MVDAARRAALAEDRLVFNGFAGAGVRDRRDVPHDPVQINTDYDRYPNYVAKAVETLKRGGVAGPTRWRWGPAATRA